VLEDNDGVLLESCVASRCLGGLELSDDHKVWPVAKKGQISTNFPVLGNHKTPHINKVVNEHEIAIMTIPYVEAYPRFPYAMGNLRIFLPLTVCL
jgi:hypothetical protein